REAQALGIDTVPTFLFDRKRAIVGSEPPQVFLDNLNKAYESRQKGEEANESREVKKGKSCNAEGMCEI
ncbi:MAG: DsbA family oxidoreductase, partial [Bacteroidia bacterium]|nr:DsbA family oxidoreductase [Bacteroidia bacterium]